MTGLPAGLISGFGKAGAVSLLENSQHPPSAGKLRQLTARCSLSWFRRLSRLDMDFFRFSICTDRGAFILPLILDGWGPLLGANDVQTSKMY